MNVLADTSYVDWASMGKILLISVVGGAGLVTLYSVGLRAISASGYLRRGDQPAPIQRRILPLLAAGICLAVVVAGAIYGVHVIFAKG